VETRVLVHKQVLTETIVLVQRSLQVEETMGPGNWLGLLVQSPTVMPAQASMKTILLV
jgi:hypothetical protein